MTNPSLLHPQTRHLLRRIEEGGAPALHALPPEEARVAYRERGLAVQPSPPTVALSQALTMPCPGGPWHCACTGPSAESKDQTLSALVYYHGGGWVVGDLDTHDTLCRELVNGSGRVVTPRTYKAAQFDVDRDFDAVAAVGETPMLLTTGSRKGPASFADAVAAAKLKPDTQAIGNLGMTVSSPKCNRVDDG